MEEVELTWGAGLADGLEERRCFGGEEIGGKGKEQAWKIVLSRFPLRLLGEALETVWTERLFPFVLIVS